MLFPSNKPSPSPS